MPAARNGVEVSAQSAADTKAAAARPLDARLAALLVRPLVDTAVTPNHLTTVRLLLGLAASAGLAIGTPAWAAAGAWLFAVSNFVDHADGELARLSGRGSHFGHCYDLASDALVHVLVFAALGYGVHAMPGYWSAIAGIVAGAAVAFIFWWHLRMENRLGRQGAELPRAGLFEIEDVLYLFPLVTIFDVRTGLLLAAAIGAPLFALWLVWYSARVGD